jgi:hypothetical protein
MATSWDKALRKEIENVKRTLLKLDNREPAGQSISDHVANITAILEKYGGTIEKPLPYFPINDLLMMAQLKNVGIPLDILALLLTVFGVDDQYDWDFLLHVAIYRFHFDAVRFLLQQGAGLKCTTQQRIDILDLLAGISDVPLDLFDLMVTEEILQTAPLLHEAVRKHNIPVIHRLVQLGANVNLLDISRKLAINYILDWELLGDSGRMLCYTLMPSDGLMMIRAICDYMCKYSAKQWSETMKRELLDVMLQRLCLPPSAVIGCDDSNIQLTVNDQPVTYAEYDFTSMYYASTLLMLLDCNLVTFPTPFIRSVHLRRNDHYKKSAEAINALWGAYKPQPRSLLNLCVQTTRASMRAWEDASFESLPVPGSIRAVLRYQHVSKHLQTVIHLWPDHEAIMQLLQDRGVIGDHGASCCKGREALDGP